MKILSNFVKHVLLEGTGAKTPDDLLSTMGAFIIVEKEDDQDSIYVYYGNTQEEPPRGSPDGYIQIKKVTSIPHYSKSGPALNAYCVVTSDATKGWGPLLYDVAMEVATLVDNSGLTPDRGVVSPSAKKVWDFYYYNRSTQAGGNVKYRQLDDPNNTLTPQKQDNALQASAIKYSGHYNWTESSLSKVYYAQGTPTIDELKKLELIEFTGMDV